MGNSSQSGGFSSYSKYISELDISNQMIRFSDFGTKGKGSINVFFRTVGLEKLGFFPYILHKINQITFLLIFTSLLIACFFSASKIWIQSSFLSRSSVLRFFAIILRGRNSLIIDVRDKEFLPYVHMFSESQFISCGKEINKQILDISKNVFDLTTPISSEEKEIVNFVKEENYIVYAHGIQKDKAPEQLLNFAKLIENTDYLIVVCGRIRHPNRNLIGKILAHKKIRYVGSLDKLVILCLLKNSGGILITGKKEGVPRIIEEAKIFSIPIIIQKHEIYLKNYFNTYTFNEFANKQPKNRYQKIKNDGQIDIQKNLEKFIFGE